MDAFLLDLKHETLRESCSMHYKVFSIS